MSKDRALVIPWAFPQPTRCRLLVLLLPIQSGLCLWTKEPLFIKGRWAVQVKGIVGGWVLGEGLIYIYMYTYICIIYFCK